MIKRGFALILLALACVCIWLGVNATQNAALAWAAAAVCIALAVLIWKGKRRAAPKAQAAHPAAHEKQEKHDANAVEIVYITRNGGRFHQHDGCTYLHGLDVIEIRKSKARKDGYRPCKKCYPYGD